jgi:mRNA degradation ribonuclease J1/J2
MATHFTSRSWIAQDLERLRQMADAGVSAQRASVILRRSIVAVKAQAKRLGAPFPDDRLLKRERRSRERESLGR